MSSEPEIAVFEDLDIQPRVKDFLVRAASSNKLSHAYLFLGNKGVGKTFAAKCLCQYLVCEHGGCGECEDCRRASHSFDSTSNYFHMDIKVIRPQSSVGYLVAQIHEIIEDVSLAAVKAKKKVYVITDADKLRGKGANALLKTIEEPPEDVLFILMAPSSDSVLPTISSRCQEVPFASIPDEIAQSLVVKKAHTTLVDAKVSLGVCHSYEEALNYLANPQRQEIRKQVVYLLRNLISWNSWQIISEAYKLNEKVCADVDDAFDAKKEKNAQYTEEIQKEYLTSKAMKELERADKRELTYDMKQGVLEVLNVADSVLRDVLLACEGVEGRCVNEDMLDTIRYIASKTNVSGVISAVGAVNKARANLSYQIDQQIVLEVMLLDIKEALCLS